MISTKLNAALNAQMNKEFYSAYAYLAVAAYFEEEELTQEELQHAMKFFEYLHHAGGQSKLESIAAPKKDFKSALAVFEHGLKQEQDLAAEISALLNLSIAEAHAPTQVFLQWFISEQVEEEALFTRYIKKLKRVGQDSNGLILLDNELAARKPDAASSAAV
jgi:ferritin